MKSVKNDTCLIPIRENSTFDVTPVNCGREVCTPGHTYYQIRDYYLIHYVESGKGFFSVNGKEYEIEKGQCFVILPFEHHHYIADINDPWTYSWIGFKGNIGSKLDSLESPIFKNDGSYFRDFLNCAEYGDMCEAYLSGKIIEFMCNEFGSKRKGFYPSIAKNMIDSNYNTKLTVEKIAESIGVDKRYLSRIFKKEYSVTMQNYILKKKMSEAYKFLKLGHPVNDVSRLVGYDDVFTFSRAFKREYGYPASSIRKSSRTDI